MTMAALALWGGAFLVCITRRLRQGEVLLAKVRLHLTPENEKARAYVGRGLLFSHSSGLQLASNRNRQDKVLRAVGMELFRLATPG